MLTRVTRPEASVTPLPGRTWYTYIGPESAPTKNVTVGVSVFPPGSQPTGHVHDTQDETVYCVAGHGRLVAGDGQVAELAPGVAVLISPGTFHATVADEGEPLELLCLFSPPVVPGSYAKKP